MPLAEDTTGDLTVQTGHVTLMLQGQIHPDSLILSPVLRMDVPPSSAADLQGSHRLVGTDPAGATLFDIQFSGVPVGNAPEQEHFNLTVSVPADQAAQLHRVELIAGDGRSISREAAMPQRAIAEALAGGDAVALERLPDGRMRLKWDAARYPLIMVRDPATNRVLSFGRGGEVTVRSGSDALEVTVSEGVRSVTDTVQVR